MNVSKKILAAFLCGLIAVSALPFAASAGDSPTQSTTESTLPGSEDDPQAVIDRLLSELNPDVLSGIDFSREPTEEEKRLLMEYYQKEAEIVFSEEFAKALMAKEQAENEAMQKSGKEAPTVEDPEFLASVAETLGFASSSGWDMGSAHAAIVSADPEKTIETYPRADGQADGLRYYANSWKLRDNAYGLQVSKGKLAHYQNAAQYALKLAHAKGSRDEDAANVESVDLLDLPQFVWELWLEQSFDTDPAGRGSWAIVSTAETPRPATAFAFYCK